MITLVSMIAWATGVAGLVTMVRGWLGPRLDDHPHCRKCHYDLTGLREGRCPECGTSLDALDAVVRSRRVRRWRQMACGFVLVVIAAAGFTLLRQWVAYEKQLPARLVRAIQTDDVKAASKLLAGRSMLASSLPLEELALRSGAQQVFVLLLKRHATGELPLGDDRRPLLHLAAKIAPWAVPLILKHGFPVDARDKEGYTALIAVVKEFAVTKSIARDLLEAGASAKATNDNGETALHFAYRCGPQDLDVIAALLEYGADINARDSRERTPLHAAMEQRSYAGVAVMALCDAGADLCAIDAQGRTPGQVAQRKGHGETAVQVWRRRLEPLVKAGKTEGIAQLLKGDKDAVNYGGAEGTLLHWASSLEDPSLASMLLDGGADANATDEYGRSPLRVSSPAVCGLLLKRGADPILPDGRGRTFLQQALVDHKGEKLAILLAHRPDMARSAHVTRHLAMAQHPDGRRMQAMLAAGAAHDVFAAIVLGETNEVIAMLEKDRRLATELQDGVPLIIPAIRAKQDEILAALLARGADANARPIVMTYEEDNARTPLHEAIAYNRKSALRMLLDHGADPNAKSYGGETSLHWACWRDAETARLLLEKGADANARDDRNRTPLHAAAAFPTDIEVLRVLVAAGADLAATDADGRTPGQLVRSDSEAGLILNAATQPAGSR